MTRRIALALLVAHLGCATAGKGAARRGAEQDLPTAAELGGGADAAALETARAQEASGDAAATPDQARAQWEAAAERYGALAARGSLSRWRVPLRQRAATLHLRAQRWERAAEAAQAIVAEPTASDASRAMGARLVASAWLGAANAAVKAGQLEKLDLGANGKGERRAPPPAWKRVLEAADAYLARAAADPEAHVPAEWRPSAGELALMAAEIQYAYGEVDDARSRLDAVLEHSPIDADLLGQVVPLYLATYLARGDGVEYAAAIDRLRERVASEAGRTPDRKEALATQLEALSRARAGAQFAAGEALLRRAKPAEAARAFEAAAEQGGPDAPNALHNAAVAWEGAHDGAKAAAARERLLADHADAAIAAEDALRLAAFRSQQGDHAAAARLYEDHLRRWPKSPSRCVALRNVATALDLAERPVDAANRYQAFGSDPRCAKADPDIAARALVRAGRLFEGQEMSAQAKSAYSGAASLAGVTDPQARSEVGEAKRRLKGL